jgi:sulfate transport system substrate-binding protein
MTRSRTFLLTLALLAAAAAGCGTGTSSAQTATDADRPVAASVKPIELLNAANDPTRELWKDLNAAFVELYATKTGRQVSIKQSHASSGGQARAVIDGLEADVVALALWGDTNQISKQGLIKAGWEDRLPNRSLAYTSPVVFVVRKGNPKQIRDWSDLAKADIEIVTPNPRTSGNGKLAFLAAWGSVVLNGGSEEQAKAFVTTIYRHVPVLDTGARGSTTTFSQKGIGDVHLTFESEAHLEVAESKGELELVYPSQTIQVEPHLSIVDAVTERHKTTDVATDYLKFLYTPEGQEIIARHYYRPIDPEVLAKHADRFPVVKLFSITEIAAGWDDVQEKFFAEGALFDRLYQSK